MDDSINIQIINKIHKELSKSLNHLLIKSNLQKNKRNKIISKNKKHKFKNFNNINNKENLNGNNYIKNRNKKFSNFLINNNKFSDGKLITKYDYFFDKENSLYTTRDNLKISKKEENNKKISNIRYIFDNYYLTDNKIIIKKNNSSINYIPRTTNIFLKKNKTSLNSFSVNDNKNLKKINNNIFNNNSNLNNLIDKSKNKRIEKIKNIDKTYTQNCKANISGPTNIKTNKQEDNNEIKLENKSNRTNNISIKNNGLNNLKSEIEEIIKDVKKEEKNININPYLTENKNLNILSKIEIDSIKGLGDYEIKNDNQDSLFIVTNNQFLSIFNNKINNYNLLIEKNNSENIFSIIGICDGHGDQGKTISNYISNIIPNKIKNYLKSISNRISKDYFEQEIEKNIKSIFNTVNIKLNSMQTIDTSFSGSCFCSLLISSSSIISINLGNSRAVIGAQKIENNKTVFYPYNITFEHTPLLEKEKKRIIENGGDVLYEKDEYNREFGPLKIWKKNILVPGLLITRSFGDKEGSLIGVISEPIIQFCEIKDEFKFIVVGSYGLWSFINNEECIKIIGKYYLCNDIHGATKEIIEIVKSRWIEEKEDILEDISIIIGFMKENKI